jgi:hypothetical protein
MGDAERTKDRRQHVESWAQVSWMLRWRHTTAPSTSSKFIIYSGKIRWSNSSWGKGCGIVILGTEGTCDHFSLNINV